MSDLFISDAEMMAAEKFVLGYLDHLSESILILSGKIQQIQNHGIQDGPNHQNLGQIRQELEEIQRDIEGLHEEMKGSAASFIEEIDNADRFIY